MAGSNTDCIDRFIEEARQVFARSSDPREQAGAIAKHMEALLVAPDLEDGIRRRANGRTGRIDLHVDGEQGHPGPGFCLMTSIPDPRGGGSRERYPHDHGASWVVYGVYKGATRQLKFRWACPEGGDRKRPKLEEYDRFTQKAGEAAFFLPGEIHMTGSAGNEGSKIIRLEAQKLDHVQRHFYGQKGETVTLVMR